MHKVSFKVSNYQKMNKVSKNLLTSFFVYQNKYNFYSITLF